MITAEPWTLIMASQDLLIKPEAAIKFLEENSRYFRIKAYHSKEDIAIQSNSANAAMCDRIIELIKARFFLLSDAEQIQAAWQKADDAWKAVGSPTPCFDENYLKARSDLSLLRQQQIFDAEVAASIKRLKDKNII